MADITAGGSASTCLEPAVVAAYADGTIDRHTRAQIAAHLADCDRCYELVAEVLRTQDESGLEAGAIASVAGDKPLAIATDAPSGIVVPFIRRRSTRMIGASLLAAAAALVIVIRIQPLWWQQLRTSPVHPSIRLLAEAVGEERPVEGRLTGGFRFGPLRSTMRSGARSNAKLALLAAAGEIEQQARTNPTIENTHALGVALLLTGEYDRSVESLEAVRLQRPDDASFATDLGVARLARATSVDRPDDLPRALEVLEHAIRIDPGRSEAWFTKALVLERLQRRDEAVRAWDRYLELDPSSRWSEEARQHNDRLKAESAKDR